MEKPAHRPSAAATPSRLFNRPLKLSVEPSEESVVELFEDDEDDEDEEGVPVEVESRDTERVNAASKSSKSKIHLRRQMSAKVQVVPFTNMTWSKGPESARVNQLTWMVPAPSSLRACYHSF